MECRYSLVPGELEYMYIANDRSKQIKSIMHWNGADRALGGYVTLRR